ncbi:class I SAM-dependent methyltransferase [uncultured Microscilla sp.]|uniref:class I SAM-dependent methyltransferase n=1 Tax=uncultured Microscilla sp. TaxID=432653 RepID=UPI00260DC833|nr:class I SAM-dependent methyltransferase [uncultured Microscilla sp.]
MKHCPACKSKNITAINNESYAQYQNNSLNQQGYKLYECRGCGLWFKDSQYTPHELQEYYSKYIEKHWNYSARLPHELRIDEILKKAPGNAAVLDVGCWTGRLLKPHTHLKRYGIEPKLESRKIAKDNGLNILSDFFYENTDLKQQFDFITLVDVFEHLSNPIEILDNLIKHLKENGKLIIITGATNAFPVYLSSYTYWYYSKIPDHIVFLNKKFLHWLESNKRIKIRKQKIRHYKFNFKKRLYELLWLISWRFINPNSPFKKSAFSKIFSARFKNVKEVIICQTWKDHYFIEVSRKK